MSRKRKITMQEIPDYFSYNRFKNKSLNIRGYVYHLCYRLSDEERELLMSYDNTEVGTMHLQYAPEIVHNVLFVYDKCIR